MNFFGRIFFLVFFSEFYVWGIGFRFSNKCLFFGVSCGVILGVSFRGERI